jgi:hypothetical protein
VPQATTANPVAATFSGLDGHPGVKKSAPVALLVGIGLLALIGLGLGGVALVKGRSTPAAGSETTASASPVGVAPASTEPSNVQAGKTAEPAASAAVEPAASAALKEQAPVATAVTPTPTAAVAGGTVVANGGAHRPGAAVPKAGAPIASAKPPNATSAAPAATPKANPKEKPINLGF